MIRTITLIIIISFFFVRLPIQAIEKLKNAILLEFENAAGKISENMVPRIIRIAD